MIKNYIKMAWRNLVRNRVFSMINLLGLALGFASSLVLFLVVSNELGFDDFHKKADRIYRITTNALDFNANVSMAVAPALKNDYPEIENITQVFYQNNGLIKIGSKKFSETRLTYADENFFRVFDCQWMGGDPKTALAEPNTVVLTESMAKKYFDRENAMGKTINMNRNDLKVTGIIKDIPSNTHLPFILVASYKTIEPSFKNSGLYSLPAGAYSYLVLPANYPVEKLQKDMKPFIKRHWGEALAKESNLVIQSLKNIHFDQRYINNIVTPTGKETYWALGGVAVFILVTACINFINLATAQAVKRSKEIGVRKVLGAYRSQLIRQFLGETAVMVTVSVFIALLIILLFLPFSKTYLAISIDPWRLTDPFVILLITGVTLLMILFSGLYPALVQSAFSPISALKNKINNASAQSIALRKTLVILQFSISQILIIGTLIVATQMDFFKNQNLGFNKNAILSFGIPDRNKSKFLLDELHQIPAITSISTSSGAPSYNRNFTSFSCKEKGLIKDDVTEMKFVDEHYMKMFGLKLLAGKVITQAGSSNDIHEIIVNETFIRKLGIQNPEDAIGINVTIGGDETLPISGVIADFQSESKHKKIRSCLLAYFPQQFEQVSIQINTNNMRETIAQVDRLWSAAFPEALFNYEFLDDHIAKLYQQEENMYRSFQLFSAIAIFIGCLGLYGLISFISIQKTKEIGIRKVLGASLAQLLYLLSKNFIGLILFSILISVPLAWLIMQQWLDNFAYRIQLTWGIFAWASFISLAIAVLTLSFKIIKAAINNPIKSLRVE